MLNILVELLSQYFHADTDVDSDSSDYPEGDIIHLPNIILGHEAEVSHDESDDDEQDQENVDDSGNNSNILKYMNMTIDDEDVNPLGYHWKYFLICHIIQ